ncbi:glycosyltransferase family 71 protein [Suhomyces tanzawaensis NRRL Y-17324]|uniref:Glycosyltransferase family 71 protein n=1 Tax=Suhomyces tanzawaensis NRRL Y-17324 TaxID=984487 RepID=A0A1E4SLQ0_9ASCO|nr:glycosyltransferase family 71 protein [Suhomyces tanzawaensis NRRL Y-17324]ODV80408.1 glycosyltransferase family 71 protein [Suhomyces tanzawaensis NRRL Y-17324]
MEDYAIKSGSIKGKYIQEKDGQAKEVFSGDESFLFSKEYLAGRLDISDALFEELKDSHTKYVDSHINKLIENYGVDTFGNVLKSDPEWSNYQGSSGYVMIGGGKYSWLSYLVIKQIRKTGAKLPIELFIASQDEYEKDFCETLLPKLNARCNVFDGKLAKELNEKFGIGGYQYKMLALLSSKFENVLYIDSDNFPTTDIDYLFDSKTYTETNLVIWPDAWARTTNPKFYEIAGIDVKEKKIRYNNYDRKQAEKAGAMGPRPLSQYTFKESAFHTFEGTLPDPASETGMLMINKTSHLKTLLLCLYYNVFGPDYYYPLFTQGSAGEGDKETFIGAAHVMGEPWFQTLKQFSWVGYFKENEGGFTSKSLGHFDPDQSKFNTEQEEEIDLIFMHLSYPKYYPDWLWNNHELVYEKSGNHIRMYESMYENVGYDFDLRVMQLFTQALCPNYYDSDGNAIDGSDATKSEYMFKYLKYIEQDDKKYTQWCTDLFIPHLKWLKETTKYKENMSL